MFKIVILTARRDVKTSLHSSIPIQFLIPIFLVIAGDTSRVRRFMKEEYVGKRRLVPTARTFALAASRAARHPQTSLEWAKELYGEFESFCNNQRADPGDKHRTKFYTDIVNIYAA